MEEDADLARVFFFLCREPDDLEPRGAGRSAQRGADEAGHPILPALR